MSIYRISNPYKKLESLKAVHQYEKLNCIVLPKYNVKNNPNFV